MKIDGIHHRSISIRENDPAHSLDHRSAAFAPSFDLGAVAHSRRNCDRHRGNARPWRADDRRHRRLRPLPRRPWRSADASDFDQSIDGQSRNAQCHPPHGGQSQMGHRAAAPHASNPAAPSAEKTARLLAKAHKLADEDAETCRMIGVHGLELIKDISRKKNGAVVNILTHCNAGWLACVDYGTATSPMYQAFDAGIPIHVWVDETRPRNQGARLTAFELGQHGIPHTVIVDNAGGHLMQHGQVDICFVGSDRTTVTGDVANKIGTYLKALAAKDNGVPFYVALPGSTFDWNMRDGVKEIPIETRNPKEVTWMDGKTADGRIEDVLLTPETSPAINYGFDVTPARLVTGLITERGICGANEREILGLWPEFGPKA
jgi:S-methyl-5-thioribose-1-phosphate isomerase